ncbi:MAG: hypothetical protein AAGJ93_11265 [Bacteroidota bacterium]
MTKKPLINNEVDLIAELSPETDLEKLLLDQPEVQEGMLWGVPRYGHPEGEVYKHVKDVFRNIDKLQITAQERAFLRIVAIVHDVFKYQEDKNRPRNWSKHHAVLARNFMRAFTKDQLLLNFIQYHDEAYYIWRDGHVYNKPEQAAARLERLLTKLNGQHQLYYLFFKCDSETGDKNPAPVLWVEANFPGIAPVVLK